VLRGISLVKTPLVVSIHSESQRADINQGNILLEIRDSIDGWGYKLDTWVDYCRWVGI
jgi:hypothetical protein